MVTNYIPSGLIELTGEHDSGKTLAALFVNYEHAPSMSDIAFFHDDVKSPGFPSSDFGLYVDLVEECQGKTLFQYREYVLARLNEIKKDQFKAIIFDTWTKFGESLRNYVIAHRYEFRKKDEFIMQHDLRVVGAQTWRDAYDYEGQVAGWIKSLSGCLVVTSHLKDDYVAGAKTSKQVDELSKTWDKICNVRFWLRANDNGVPTVLALKRIHKPGKNDKGQPITVNVLPRRFEPSQDDYSIWDIVNRYWNDPIGNRELNKDEVPTRYELSILDGILTDDQKELWRANLREAEKQKEVEDNLLSNEYQEVKVKVLEMKDKPLPVIYQAISQQYGNGYDLGTISKILKGD